MIVVRDTDLREARSIRIALGDSRFGGAFKVEKGQVKLVSAYGSSSAPLSGRSPEQVAGDLLREAVLAWMSRNNPAGFAMIA